MLLHDGWFFVKPCWKILSTTKCLLFSRTEELKSFEPQSLFVHTSDWMGYVLIPSLPLLKETLCFSLWDSQSHGCRWGTTEKTGSIAFTWKQGGAWSVTFLEKSSFNYFIDGEFVYTQTKYEHNKHIKAPTCGIELFGLWRLLEVRCKNK